MTLVEFLRARLDEDEQILQALIVEDRAPKGAMEAWQWENSGFTPAHAAFLARYDWHRAALDIKAKRRIIEEYRWYFEFATRMDAELHAVSAHPDQEVEQRGRAREQPPMVLRLLALPYAEHEGYRPEWAPDA
jgi:hypothetical protein